MSQLASSGGLMSGLVDAGSRLPKALKFVEETHYPNESLTEGFPPKKFGNDPARGVGLPPIPEFAIPSQHPGAFPPPDGPATAGSLEIPNMYPTNTIRGFTAISAMLQTMSALNLLKDASAQAVTIVKGNITARTRSEEAYNEALQMDPDLQTKAILRELQAQSRRAAGRSEKFIHQMTLTVKQAELAVQAMKEQMGPWLDTPKVVNLL